jgi:hypothetical protein
VFLGPYSNDWLRVGFDEEKTWSYRRSDVREPSGKKTALSNSTLLKANSPGPIRLISIATCVSAIDNETCGVGV